MSMHLMAILDTMRREIAALRDDLAAVSDDLADLRLRYGTVKQEPIETAMESAWATVKRKPRLLANEK